jgi:hypothetical protein
MPAINFKKQFADKVRMGIKTQTIRAKRKDGKDPKVGDKLYLYTGMRTSSCEKLGEAVVKSVFDIVISPDGDVTLNKYRLSLSELSELARLDGFESLVDFADFFDHGNGKAFKGLLIEW